MVRSDLLCQPVEGIRLDLPDIVIVESESGDLESDIQISESLVSSYLAQTPESSSLDDRNVVLVQINVIQLPELSQSVSGNSFQLIVGEDEVLERSGQSGETIWHQGV